MTTSSGCGDIRITSDGFNRVTGEYVATSFPKITENTDPRLLPGFLLASNHPRFVSVDSAHAARPIVNSRRLRFFGAAGVLDIEITLPHEDCSS